MRSLRFVAPVALLLLTTAALAPSEAQDMDAPQAAAPRSGAQISFDTMKSLAGEWEGVVNVPEAPQMSGATMHVSMRVTSRGHALVHELQEAGTPLDPTK